MNNLIMLTNEERHKVVQSDLNLQSLSSLDMAVEVDPNGPQYTIKLSWLQGNSGLLLSMFDLNSAIKIDRALYAQHKSTVTELLPYIQQATILGYVGIAKPTMLPEVVESVTKVGEQIHVNVTNARGQTPVYVHMDDSPYATAEQSAVPDLYSVDDIVECCRTIAKLRSAVNARHITLQIDADDKDPLATLQMQLDELKRVSEGNPSRLEANVHTLPKYRRIGFVWAEKIKSIEGMIDPNQLLIHLDDAKRYYEPVQVSEAWLRAKSAQVGGYLIFSQDGHLDWQSANMFEAGHIETTSGSDIYGDLAPYSTLQHQLKQDNDCLWGWQCNLAMSLLDAMRREGSQEDDRGLAILANRLAAAQLQHVFKVDIKSDPRYVFG